MNAERNVTPAQLRVLKIAERCGGLEFDGTEATQEVLRRDVCERLCTAGLLHAAASTGEGATASYGITDEGRNILTDARRREAMQERSR